MTTLENLIENPDEWEVGYTIISYDLPLTNFSKITFFSKILTKLLSKITFFSNILS